MSGFLKLVKLSATTMLDRFDGIQYTFAFQCGKIGSILWRKIQNLFRWYVAFRNSNSLCDAPDVAGYVGLFLFMQSQIINVI